MTKSTSSEIQVVSRNNNIHIVNLRNMASATTTTTTTARPPSYLRSIRKKRPSHFILFMLSTLTTLFNVLNHVFMFITTLAALPLLLIALLATRILQLARHGDGYDKAVKLKTLIRAWIRIGTWLILIATVVILIVLLILKHGFNMSHVSVAHHRVGIGMLLKWSKLICLVSGVYFLLLSSTVFLYLLPRIPLEHSSTGIHIPETLTEIVECLIFLWAVSEISGHCKSLVLYGLNLEKWIEVFTLVLIGHDFLTLSTHMIAWSTRRLVNRHLKPGADTKSQWYLFVQELLLRQYLVYYVTGLRKSFSFILSSLMILLTWVFYFGVRLDDKRVYEFGKWSFFSLVICSFLWLIKSCVILSWEASVIYDRLTTKILEAGEVLYFLGVVGRSKFDIFGLLYTDRQCRESEEENKNTRQTHLIGLYIVSVLGLVSVDRHRSQEDKEEECWDESNGCRKVVKMSIRKRKLVRDELLLMQRNGVQTVYNVQQMSQYILAAKDVLSKERFISDILDRFNRDADNREILKKITEWKNESNNEPLDSDSSVTIEEKDEKTESHLDDWEYFDKLLKNVHSSEESSFLKIEAWMERAHNKCLRLANMLKSAKEVVDCLNKIISGSIIVATFIMWLLLTELATTKVLVLIASPLLAATFIFGDTCKALFQGIIFIYVVHPFDVGDLCVIGAKLRVVKAIGVWKTVFSKVDSYRTREEVIYPNSELAKEVVINHKTEFDWDNWDYYQEFDLGSWRGDNIANKGTLLKNTIEEHLKEKEEVYKLIPSSHRVALLTVGDDIKIAIRLKYKIDNTGDIQDWTYINCLQQKHIVQAEFDLFMDDFVHKYKK